mmetsp:Transcript_86582/g.229955  ORF Transcript_86582/g.229955 Transcript_86582/m.229955 type:complete len:93 (+) Transcript_86582:84-362(+)|eukprot:CAMPEP_0171173024 /NCGR_PEP_ID=MMETSP0790-20130122/10013_1 /TAXON_ID=2925 /ORGANISM="Alexandrium catenella, Strain OF101" /LENGTH=92 /DNA_ID=CAMNT_0011637883 /DNA_START=85 /DNA_END=363 /DNA_ORIENTATION=+
MPRVALALLLLQIGAASGASLRGARAGEGQAAPKGLAEDVEATWTVPASIDDIGEEVVTSFLQTPVHSARSEKDCEPKPGGLESILLQPETL